LKNVDFIFLDRKSQMVSAIVGSLWNFMPKTQLNYMNKRLLNAF